MFGHADWRDNVAGMIREHHKVRSFGAQMPS